LAKTIDQVLSTPAMRNRAAEIGKTLARENGVEMAVRLVEQRLGKDAVAR